MRPRRGQRRETDRASGNGIRVPPEDDARHRLRGFSVLLIGFSCAVAPIAVPKRHTAAAHFLRTFAIAGVHVVYTTTSKVEGAYIRLQDEERGIRSQAPVGSSARVARIFTQWQRPVYASI